MKAEVLRLPRCRSFRGEIALPGSKSIANRVLLLAALCAGRTRLINVPDSDDVSVLLNVLPSLGVTSQIQTPATSGVNAYPGRVLEIVGSGGPFAVDRGELFLGNAGTALRPLTAVLAASRGEFLIDGDEQMRRRPSGDLTDALRQIGVEITGSGEGGGYPPLRLRARGLRAGTVRLSGRVSSQYISALLIAAPLAERANAGDEFIIEVTDDPVSKPYIDLTLDLMARFGVNVARQGYRHFRVPGGPYRSPGEFRVEGDASAATYFLAAGSLPGAGPVRVRGLSREHSTQGDARFADVLAGLGARITSGPDWTEAQGAAARLVAVNLDMNAMPDAAMTLAVLALFMEGTTHIRNIANLRVKESERIRGLRVELEKLGAAVVEEPDALRITPPDTLRPARIATYNDHRMAMAFSLASFGADLEIENPGCVSKTYPDYFQDFAKIRIM